MKSTMLIDSAHSEETRVAIVRGQRVEGFDYETERCEQLVGNIYLGKVTRVEPSLQAAFVDYGGSRHGFISLDDIYPNYFQIPVVDRELEESLKSQNSEADEETDDSEIIEDNDSDISEAQGPSKKIKHLVRKYKIQEVIKKGQILLVQIVREERGVKGAALTTYISLAGRYCVLMPCNSRGGGISRKITETRDRKRLKEITSSLEIPEGMGLIVRTAGANRTKTEVKRDLNYLLRVWEDVRQTTLKAKAPALVYSEGGVVQRAIRDLYSREIGEVIVSGEESYKAARALMKLLMPSHVRNIKLHKLATPLFAQYKIEEQLDMILSPNVTLPSGGYIVINQTEALVAIDINSGRTTNRYSVEETALATNLEAADEIALQLRLRDLAGLIVIDFIDMKDRSSNKQVEQKLRSCLKIDRARIMVGRISNFGLLEMSRQRKSSSLLDTTTEKCPVCQGNGKIKSLSLIALNVLRSLTDYLSRTQDENVKVNCGEQVCWYLLNTKRDHIQKLEKDFNCSISISPDSDCIGNQFKLEGESSLKEKAKNLETQEERKSKRHVSSSRNDKKSRRNKKQHNDQSSAEELQEEGSENIKKEKNTKRKGNKRYKNTRNNVRSEKSENKIAQKSENKIAQTTENKTAQTTENKTAQKAENKTAQKTENKTAQKTENKTAQKAENKTAQKTENKTAQKTENKTAQKTENKTAQKAENKTAQKTENKTAQNQEVSNSESKKDDGKKRWSSRKGRNKNNWRQSKAKPVSDQNPDNADLENSKKSYAKNNHNTDTTKNITDVANINTNDKNIKSNGTDNLPDKKLNNSDKNITKNKIDTYENAKLNNPVNETSKTSNVQSKIIGWLRGKDA